MIDPITPEARLISYERDEDACVAVPAARINKTEKFRAEKTIEVLGLNKRDRLNQKRADFWDHCLMAIADHSGAEGPQALRLVRQASAMEKLKGMIAYKAEFSSVVEACIRKNASESLMSELFSQDPNPNHAADRSNP